MATPAINPAGPGDWDGSPDSKNKDGDAALLDRIRTRFRYMTKAFEKIRDRGDLDMQALGPDGPWDPVERKLREDNKRPCIHLDQLNQYPNTLVNQVRENPQGVKVNPAGYGASDKTATLRGDRIRAIEYECNATQAYLTALKCAAQRGYGVLTMEVEEIAWDGFDQRIKIVREPDPNAVLYDPDCKEADSSDMQDGFKVWRLPIADFKRAWPGAEITDFNLELRNIAPEWVNKETVQVARYSYIEKKKRYVYLVDDGSPKGLKLFKDELPAGVKAKNGVIVLGGKPLKILKEKDAVQKCVKQCVTNGLEILDRNDWAGQWIPIFPMYGEEKYVRVDGVTERVLESYVRNAIDGQRAFDSAKTNEVEAANMVPKIIYLGYEGQFATSTDWKNINKVPSVYGEVKRRDAEGEIMALPTRESYDPPINSMEVMAEAARRAIQAAIGSHGFTVQDDTNVKSGKAVALLSKQSDVGSYHFIDNYETTIRHVGRAIDDMLAKIEDTPRDVATRAQDGTTQMVHLNEPVKDPKTGQMVEHRYTPRDPATQQPMTDAKHDVVIDTGPSYQTQRDQAMAFVQSIMGTDMGPRIADLAVRWQDLGPYGDQMAERLVPPEFATKEGEAEIPPQVKQQMGQLTQQNQRLQELNQQLMNEKEAKTLEANAKVQIQQISSEAQKAIQQMKDATAIAVAGLAQKGQLLQTHEELSSEENLAMAAQQHQADMAQKAQDAAAAQSAQDASQGSAQSAQDAGQASDASAQGADQAAAAAAAQPPEPQPGEAQ